MAKVRVTKDAVYKFVRKVEEKAVKAIRDEYQQKYDDAVEEWFYNDNKGEIIQKLIDLNNLIYKGKAMFEEINNVNGSEVKGRWRNKEWENENLTFTKSQLFDAYALPTCKAKQLHEEWKTRENEVTAEYRKLRALCEGARDGNTAMNLLKSLGFDVSYILQYKPDSPVDTSKLFVCNEKGAE